MRITGAVVAGAVALALTACAGPGAAPAQTPIPLASAWRPGLLVDGYGATGLAPSPTTSAPTDPAQQALASVSLQQADFGSGLTVALAADGTSLAKPSLAYCDGTFTSEAGREARRRTIITPTGSRDISTEAVYYRTVADASTALSEMRAAAAACPTHRTATAGDQTLVLDVVADPGIDTAGLVPAAQRLVIATDVDAGSGTDPYRLTRIWQQRGRVLVGLFYGSASTAFTAQDRSDVALLSSGIAAHLDALSSEVTGTG